MSDMTNEQIVSEFESLFASEEEAPEEQAPETPDEETEENEEDETNPEEAAEETEEQADESDEEESKEEPAPKDTKQSRQNHAFAEQRLQIKKQNDFIKKVGRLVGFDDNTNTDEILEKVNEALLEKQSKEQNIPVDILKRLERAESLIQENDQIKLEKQVTEAFTDLIDEHNLSKEEVDEFTNHLINIGKNPMLDANVDLQAEYLKLHYKDMVKAAVEEALAKEGERKKKVDEQASSSVGNSPNDKEEAKVTSVKELDDLFANMDL
jgi:small nuclear ribonucleoprotein (snRNP)-like protein